MAATTTRPALTDEHLVELMALIKGADSVELKLTVPEDSQTTSIQALGVDPLSAQIRQVFFFDTPDLTLYHHGVVPRARRVQGRDSDSVVKLRPVVPDNLPKAIRKNPAFGVEVDAMPGGFVCSGSLKGTLGTTEVREVALGQRRISTLFSKEQRAFYTEHAPDGLELDDLSILGPMFVLKDKFTLEGYPRRMVAELWFYPDGSRLLELSTKCLPGQAFQAAAETRAILSARGIDLAGEQETKTRKALDFFAEQLKTADGKQSQSKPMANSKKSA